MLLTKYSIRSAFGTRSTTLLFSQEELDANVIGLGGKITGDLLMWYHWSIHPRWIQNQLKKIKNWSLDQHVKTHNAHQADADFFTRIPWKMGPWWIPTKRWRMILTVTMNWYISYRFGLYSVWIQESIQWLRWWTSWWERSPVYFLRSRISGGDRPAVVRTRSIHSRSFRRRKG